MEWTFSPYNPEKYKKSKHRVMFVGADPNDTKKTNEKLSKKDMGEWFRERPEGFNNFFYQRLLEEGVFLSLFEHLTPYFSKESF